MNSLLKLSTQLSKMLLIRNPIRFYHDKIIDHYENPRNVGSLDKNSKNVGTGMVGAPACIHEDTLISLADGRRYETVKNLYKENRYIKVWSYNTKNKIYEIKNAKIIKRRKKKEMIKITFDDSSLICTKDHKFLTRNNEYIESEKLTGISITPFKRSTTKEETEMCNDYKIINIKELQETFDCYDLQVEENNNFAVITNVTKNSGIIIKNCGDVIKLQIEVDDNGKIVKSKFKSFGCGSAIASSSLTTEWVKGKHIDDAIEITNRDIAKHLKLPPVKLHCSNLSEDAIKAAIKDYKSKNKI